MEGPSVRRVADELAGFEGQTIQGAGGNANQPLQRLEGHEIEAVRAVKKRLFLDADPWHVVVHFLMYGSYRVNERRDLDERLALECDQDTLNIYSCSVKVLEDGDRTLAEYDRPSEDVLSDAFDLDRAVDALLEADRPVADVLLDQSVFGGVGNIVKNEVLWETGIHPLTSGTVLDRESATALAETAVSWTAEWYQRKRDDAALNMQVYRGDDCPECGAELQREELGEYDRISYWCPDCQPA